MRTVPLLSRVPLCDTRGTVMLPIDVKAPTLPLADGSNRYALATVVLPLVCPPAMSTLPPHAHPGFPVGHVSSVAVWLPRPCGSDPVAVELVPAASMISALGR